MHIKAIQIKEQLLGQEDYEVALSVGHLASLYNYDMNQYEDAERLYLRSIAIGRLSIAQIHGARPLVITRVTDMTNGTRFTINLDALNTKYVICSSIMFALWTFFTEGFS